MAFDNEKSYADPVQGVSGRVLADKERNKVLIDWNATATDYPRDQSVHKLFEARAAITPEAVAVVCGEQCLTYAGLNARANQLARYLRSQGVGPGVLVAICVERSLEMVIGVLGILKAGGAYVPLDPHSPKDRLSFMLEDTGAPVLVTQAVLTGRLPESEVEVLCLDSDRDRIDRESDGNVENLTDPEHLAYIIYTSGSTGRPKGVEIRHRSLTNLVSWYHQRTITSPTDRATLISGPAFDASVADIWPTITAGASLHIPDEETRLSPDLLLNWYASNKITVSFLPTPLAALLIDLEQPADLALRILLTGGDRLKKGPGKALPYRFINTYGPTESTVDTTWGDIEAEQDSPPIGRPIGNTQTYILDAQMEPVPVGVVGELYIGGDGLARGYLNHPELTAERFVPNPLPDTPGERLYKTGDLVRYRADGNIEFLGRSDDQVKIRGFRIELGEIEATLSQHPQVQDSLVMVWEENDNRKLVGYVVGDPNDTALPQILRSALGKTLPDYMIPIQILVLDVFPLTPNDKIDRKALPEPDLNELARAEYEAPRNETERVLAGIWSEVLDLDADTLSINANFFDLGGHSLSATQLLTRIKNKLQKNLKFTELFDNPTIKALAEICNRKEFSKSDLNIIPAARETQFLETSFSQDQVVFLNQLNPDSIAYNFPVVIEFTGDLDIALLEDSLSEIVRRHEIFRTTFTIEQGVSRQIVQDPWRVKVPVVDLQGGDASSVGNAIDEITSAELGKKIATDKLPLVLWKLIKTQPEKHLFIHIEHHLVHDGWSFAVFVKELKEIYSARKHGRDPDLPELPFQFADYAKWQRSYFRGQALEELLSYWEEVLVPPITRLELPSDHPRPKAISNRGDEVRMDIDPFLSDSIRKYCKENEVTLFSFLFSVYVIFINRYTRQQDIVIGTGVANRNTEDSEHVIGMFVNAIPVRFSVQNDKYFSEFVKQTMRRTLEAYDYQGVPFELLVKHLNPERYNNFNPIFQTMFSFHDSQVPSLDIDELRGEIRYLHNGSSKFDIGIVGIPWAEQRFRDKDGASDHRVTLLWEFSTDLFYRSTIERMTRHYQTLLEQIVAHPDKPISDYELLTPAEQHQLLFDWNASEAAWPKDQCIQQLFEAQVARSPEAVAVVHADRQLSYAELNARANRLAHYLIEQGVGPDVLVAICVERSLDLVVTVLGILKAGGAYVPLDPGYPKERLAFMLEDTDAPVLITRSSLQAALPPHTATVLCLDDAVDPLGAYADTNPAVRTQPHHLAYINYTSGSTGKPKGVCIPHQAVTRLVFGANYVTLDANRTLLHMAPISFDAATFELWGALLHGGRCVLYPEPVPTPEGLKAVIAEQGVDTLFITTALFNAVMDLVPEAFKPIRQLLTGGEAHSVDHIKKACALLTDTRISNIYGPTESTTFATHNPLTQPLDDTLGSIPIGRPVSNTQVYILDAQLKPVPIGVVGELYIGGDGLARGYLNRPELTAECFIANPLAGTPGERLYKTGDLVRYLADGLIEFMGRSDDQVKIRGFRIEPGEIEASLKRHPQVQDSLVMVRDEEAGGKRLVAYVVAGQVAEDFTAILRDFLKQTLPEYMVPSAFIMLDALPLTPNGKVDRKALSAIDLAKSQETEYVAPRTPVEEELAAIWCGLLQLERVGVHDDFFHLGGHSLLAMQVMPRIKSVFQVDLALRTFFENPTVAEMSLKVINIKMEKANDQDLESILSELEEITDEEALMKGGSGQSANIADD